VRVGLGQEIAEINPADGLPRLSAKWNEYKIKLCLLSAVIGHLWTRAPGAVPAAPSPVPPPSPGRPSPDFSTSRARSCARVLSCVSRRRARECRLVEIAEKRAARSAIGREFLLRNIGDGRSGTGGNIRARLGPPRFNSKQRPMKRDHFRISGRLEGRGGRRRALNKLRFPQFR